MKIMTKVINMVENCAKRNKFEKICKMPQYHLKKYLAKELEKTHKQITVDDGFVYAQGKFPVLLVAHMDTVHNHLPQTFVYSKDKNKISDPNGIGGDDRCGVYMILEVIKRFNCSVLFCEDEEVGCVGADKFIETKLASSLDFNYMIEFDRKGSRDAVFYDCDNPEFTKFICKDFYIEDWGSCSDISVLAPFFGVAAVNLSCGYYNAHKDTEYVVFSEMERSIEEACRILERTTEDDVFEYIPSRRNWGLGAYYSTQNTGYTTGWYDEDDFYYNGGWGYDSNRNTTELSTIYHIIEYRELDGNVYEYEVDAVSTEEAIGMWAIEHPHLSYNHVIGILDDSEPYM
jgi:hypothetical protein